MEATPRGIRGQVLLFTGEGKGKTTAAFGVALRAIGRGWNVIMIQFTKMGEWPKGEPLGEIAGAAPASRPTSRSSRRASASSTSSAIRSSSRSTARRPRTALSLPATKSRLGQYELVILDEILGAVDQGQVDLEQVLESDPSKPHAVNLLLTGHDANRRFLDRLLPRSIWPPRW